MGIQLFPRIRTLLTIVCLTMALLSFPSSILGASLETQLDDVNKELEETREKVSQTKQEESELSKEIADIDKTVASIDATLRSLQTELANATARRNRTEAELEELEEQLRQKGQELRKIADDLERQQAVANQRAQNVYKDGELGYLEILLKANDFSDFLTRAYLLQAVLSEDLRILDVIETLQSDVELKKEEIAGSKEETERKREQLRTEEARLRELVKAQADNKKQAKFQASKKSGLLEEVRENKAEYLEAEAELERTSAQIAERIRAARSSNRPVSASGFAWPTAGELSSGFGMRQHPIFGSIRMHTGIDIAAPYGQQVTASRGGTVIIAGLMGGYGQAVIVDHGDGLSTLYAHLSAIQAQEGEYVVGGSVIGKVGCSGYCTGPHLHFEIRADGEPENPLKWL